MSQADEVADIDRLDRRQQQEETEELGRRLRDAREYLGLSQELVAEKLAIPRASVSAIEAGRRKVGSLELKRLAALYRRPVSAFLDEDVRSAAGEDRDSALTALYRAARNLSDQDREQVIRFAQFLRQAGPAEPIATRRTGAEPAQHDDGQRRPS